MKFSANLGFLWTDRPLPDAIRAARAAGFDAVECHWPYDTPADAVTAALAETGLPMLGLNTIRGKPGEFGLSALPDRVPEARAAIDQAIAYATATKTGAIHVMAGNANGLVARQTFVENLRWAADEAPDMQLTIEPINGHDMPGYYLNDFDQAAEILDEVNAKNLGLQFDMYHAQMITGDGMSVWETHGNRAVHVQIGGVPGRHEPMGGDIDYPAFFAALDSGAYKGWVSAEYNPEGDTRKGLGWMDMVKGS